jgi:polysaccharide biosynthesis/export protein
MHIFLSSYLPAFLTLALAASSIAQTQTQNAAAPRGFEFGANLPAQPVGPNDLIGVSVYDAPELSRTVRVGDDGFIRLPMLHHPIKAQGLLPAALETAIAAALREDRILVDPFVTVTIAEYHSRPISVVGAVRQPLVFQAEGQTTLLEVITRAQGLREDAGREILVSQTQPGIDDKPVVMTRRILVRGLIDDADPALNIKLTGGEEIRVPEMGRVYVVGNVKKPGSFPVQDGSETTVLQMVALAEGLTPYTTKEAYIYRREAGGKKNEILVPLEKIMQRKAPDVPLTANDILYIPESKGRRLTGKTVDALVGLSGSAAAALIITTH